MKNFLKKFFNNIIVGVFLCDIWALIMLPLAPIVFIIANSIISHLCNNDYDEYQEVVDDYRKTLLTYRCMGILVKYSLAYLRGYIEYRYFVKKLSKISKTLQEQEI